MLLATAGCGPGREIRELVQRGDQFRSEGRPRRSLAAYEAALALDPEHVPAHLGIGILHASQGQPEQAIARYRQILELDPSSATAHTEWARALLQQGRAPDAAREAAEASRIDPSSADALRVHGIAYARTDQLERAIEKFQQADALDPDPTADVLVAWGRALRDLGRTREARAKLEGALSSDLDDEEATYLLSSCLLEVDAERRRGIRLLERALRVDPSNPE